MNLTAFVIKIAFLALPGLIASKLYRKARGRTTKKNWEDFFEVLLFSLTSYLLLGLFTNEVTFFKSIYDEKTLLNWHEIGYASLIAILLAIIASYLHTYGIATWLFRKIGASYRIADEDIWELFHNSRKSGDWLFVRDHKIHVIYFGYIKFYSDSEKDRELVIENVSVFDENSNLLYKCSATIVSQVGVN